jgi:hypothetical protein
LSFCFTKTHKFLVAGIHAGLSYACQNSIKTIPYKYGY